MADKQVPEIRFKGFTEDWELCKLADVTKRVKSYSLSREIESDTFTGFKYIHYGDIHTKVADIVTNNSLLPDINEGDFELLRKGDIVLADASEDYQGIATPAVIYEEPTFKLVSGLHTIALRPITVNGLYLYYLFKSSTFRKYGYKTGTGMKVFGISVTNILKFEGNFPSIDEQEKIGTFLKKIDDTITLHQRKLRLLHELKQGLLQQIFPHKGEEVPKLRFNGFSGNWSEIFLKDIVIEQIKGKAQYEKLGAGSIEYLDASRLNGGDPIYTNGRKDVESEDILILWDGSKAGTVYIGFEGALGSTLKRYRTSENSQFVYQLLKFNQDNIYNNYRTPNIPHVQKDFLHVFKIQLPNIVEQQAIGQLFKQIDDTITLYQQKLTDLEVLKQAYLQKMFI